MASRREQDQEAAWREHLKHDPAKDSEFARTRELAEHKGTPEGIDPQTGERAAVTYRQLVNETGGDERAARMIFDDVARKGGYGSVGLDQALDVRGLNRSVREYKDAADRGVDIKTGRPLDKYGEHEYRQLAQHQDNLVNAVGETLERLRKG